MIQIQIKNKSTILNHLNDWVINNIFTQTLDNMLQNKTN